MLEWDRDLDVDLSLIHDRLNGKELAAAVAEKMEVYCGIEQIPRELVHATIREKALKSSKSPRRSTRQEEKEERKRKALKNVTFDMSPWVLNDEGMETQVFTSMRITLTWEPFHKEARSLVCGAEPWLQKRPAGVAKVS